MRAIPHHPLRTALLALLILQFGALASAQEPSPLAVVVERYVITADGERVNAAAVHAGQTVEYLITVRQPGTTPRLDPVIRLLIPDFASYIDGTATKGPNINPEIIDANEAPAIRWTYVGTLEAGASFQVSARFTVNDTTQPDPQDATAPAAPPPPAPVASPPAFVPPQGANRTVHAIAAALEPAGLVVIDCSPQSKTILSNKFEACASNGDRSLNPTQLREALDAALAASGVDLSTVGWTDDRYSFDPMASWRDSDGEYVITTSDPIRITFDPDGPWCAVFSDVDPFDYVVGPYGGYTYDVAQCVGFDHQDEFGQTPLIYAITAATNERRFGEVLRYSDPNHRTLAGWTPLMYAARLEDPLASTFIAALLEAGAEKNARAPDGTSVASLAAANPHLDAATRAALAPPPAPAPAPGPPAVAERPRPPSRSEIVSAILGETSRDLVSSVTPANFGSRDEGFVEAYVFADYEVIRYYLLDTRDNTFCEWRFDHSRTTRVLLGERPYLMYSAADLRAMGSPDVIAFLGVGYISDARGGTYVFRMYDSGRCNYEVR